MNPAVVIPTFHVAAGRRQDPAATVFDHPTPLDMTGDLYRCLESLTKVRGLGQVIVIAAAEDPAVAAQAVVKAQDICNRFPTMHTLVIGEASASIITQRLEQFGFEDLSHAIGLGGYSAVRNLGLVVANILGFDAVVFIDDDEVIEDVEFLAKAMYGLGKLTKKGIPILAKSGYYLNSEQNYYSLSQNKWYNHYWQQGSAFNAWISRAMAGPRLSRSNHVCGGCLALHREAYKRISFDPWIMRGEDLDYLLDLRMYGSDVWFDNQWSLLHLPPRERHEGHRFRRDIYRWLYEYYKIEFSRSQIDLLQINPSSLEPYPGPFLEPGILKRVKRTAFLRSLVRPDKQAYRTAAKEATVEASAYAQENCSKYFEFQYVWGEVMQRTERDAFLTQALIQAAVARQKGDEVIVEASAIEQQVQEPASASIDPGTTTEIHLNLADFE